MYAETMGGMPIDCIPLWNAPTLRSAKLKCLVLIAPSIWERGSGNLAFSFRETFAMTEGRPTRGLRVQMVNHPNCAACSTSQAQIP
jgi:hypothetical protein